MRKNGKQPHAPEADRSKVVFEEWAGERAGERGERFIASSSARLASTSRMKAVIRRRRRRAAAAQKPSFQAFRLPRGAPERRNFPPPQPCMRQRDRPWTAGDRQAVPARVRAPQRGAARSRAASAVIVFSPVLIGISFRFHGRRAACLPDRMSETGPQQRTPRPVFTGRSVKALRLRGISVSRKDRNASPWG